MQGGNVEDRIAQLEGRMQTLQGFISVLIGLLPAEDRELVLASADYLKDPDIVPPSPARWKAAREMEEEVTEFLRLAAMD